MDVAGQKKRLYLMLAICGVCTLSALAGIVGNMVFGVAWMVWWFLGSLLVGFAAQGWLMLGLAKAAKELKHQGPESGSAES